MYLTARKYVSNWEFQVPGPAYAAIVEAIRAQEIVTDQSPSLTVSITCCYWHKANAIHAWFVRECQGGVDECQEVYVPREKVQKLRDLCKLIIKDPSLAERLLPPQSGFFFGSTEIDDWYRKDVERTVTELDRVLNATAEGEHHWQFYYRASW